MAAPRSGRCTRLSARGSSTRPPTPISLTAGIGGTRAFLAPVLAGTGLRAELADALEDASFDAEIGRETDEALALTGKDVGTPIIQFQPPAGIAFFGPVISRLPSA